MINLQYDPFLVEFDNLEPRHLSVLTDVSEGWYVEYKRQSVSSRSIAKSISAFANHYGGWLFYGIVEANDGSNRAQEFPGLDVCELSVFLEQIRNAAKDSIHPSPYYEYKVLSGPCEAIGLPIERAIVVVAVPSGPDAPYVHSDGRIYRRVADSSDPKPETDRFILDQLWQRRQEANRRLSGLLSSEQILSQGEEDVSYLDLFLLTDPLGGIRQKTQLSFEQFVEAMRDTTTPGVGLCGDNFYAMADGYVARQINEGDPYNLVLTWKHYRDGSSIVTIPFSSTRVASLEIGGWLHHYKHEAALIQLLHSRKHGSSYLLDLNQLMVAVTAAVNQQRKLLLYGKLNEFPLYGKAALHNLWRRIPFIDTDSYIRFITDCGFPVLQISDEMAPPDISFDSLVLIPGVRETQNEEDHVYDQFWSAGHILGFILNGLGLPIKAVFDDKNSEDSFWEASQRVAEVSKHRKILDNKDSFKEY
ncbi:MAG: ATP-binding protein [Caldilineaceae bacterium]|nr:ATP-binding protein [Caldilineaceae bacterium]